MTKMNRRLQQLLIAENITQAQLATRLNVAPASISHILSGRNKPGYDFIVNTMKAFPNLNIEWLISGQGKMYKDSSDPSQLHGYSLFSDDEAVREQPVKQEPDVKTSDAPQFQNSRTDAQPDGNTGFPNREDSPAIPIKSPERQRKAAKIVVFYDDGTFQEFR